MRTVPLRQPALHIVYPPVKKSLPINSSDQIVIASEPNREALWGIVGNLPFGHIARLEVPGQFLGTHMPATL